MAKRLLVEGLNWGVNDQQLARVFAPFGELAEAKVAIDWETGRSRGFGYVTFVDSDDAEAAIAGLDGQKLANKTLRVMVAPEQGQRPAYRGGDFGYTDPATAAKGTPFRNADFDPPRGPRTDRKLFRSADFGYVEDALPATPAPAEPAPAPSAETPAGEKKPERSREGREAAAPERGPRGAEAAKAAAAKKSEEGEGLDDEERANRAKFGGWREVDENDGGVGGGGNPFG